MMGAVPVFYADFSVVDVYGNYCDSSPKAKATNKLQSAPSRIVTPKAISCAPQTVNSWKQIMSSRLAAYKSLNLT